MSGADVFYADPSGQASIHPTQFLYPAAEFPAGGKHSFQKQIDQFNRRGVPDDLPAQRDDLDIVMLYALVGCIDVMANTGTDSGHLVAGDAGANPGAAEHNSPLTAAVQNRFADFFRDIGKINRFRVIAAKVSQLVAFLFQVRQDLFFQGKPGVVGTNRNAHIIPSFQQQFES